MTQVHLIGIGGSGLSAIARLLLERGYTVSGSDQEFSPLAREIQELGAIVRIGHRSEYVLGADEVIRSSAIPDDNVEILAAISTGIPVYKRSDYVGKLIEDRIGIAVAGTHGKTTTTAMLSWMLTDLNKDPSYIIGGIAKNMGVNAHAGEGRTFVIEADEYDYMFLGLQPQIAIVTNIEHDHPDCFPTAEDFFQAFVDFARQIPEKGTLILCSDDDGASKLLEMASEFDCQVFSYGIHKRGNQGFPDYYANSLSMTTQGFYEFNSHFEGELLSSVSLNIPGIHNVSNALATLAVAHHLEIPVSKAGESVSKFQGTLRRFDLSGEIAGITVIDDYAHHPSEIRATLNAARNRYPGRPLWAVWQPHTYSRTEKLFEEYLSAFEEADHVLVTEIFASREPVNEEFSSLKVVQSMSHPDVHFLATNDQVSTYLISNLQEGDVLLVLSAGDAYQISERVIDSLSKNGNSEHG